MALLRAVHPDTVAMADYGRGYNMAKRFRFEVNLRNATIRVSWSETRPLGDICRFFFLESLYYLYLNVGLFHSREEAQKGEIFRDPEPIVFFFLRPQQQQRM